MEFLKNIKWTPLNVFKAVGVALAALFLLSFLLNIFGSVNPLGLADKSGFSLPAQDAYMDGDYGYADDSEMYAEERNPKLSINNIAPSMPVPQPAGTVGGDAEEYEVTEYFASIETSDANHTCQQVTNLKSYEYVVFESSNEYDKGCSYVFKVAHENVEEVLGQIESLDPKTLSENTYTIKRQVDDFTSEQEILEKKLQSIDETLTNAVAAYDELSVVAKNAQDVESLTQVINNKIMLIERLTQERLNTVAMLERLLRSKAEQLDRLEYTYFHVDVFENKFIDGEQLQESWKSAIREAVYGVNQALQNMSITLIPLLFGLIQYILYFFILLLVVKYLWKAARRIWEK
jgi:hypothetical protein